MEISLPTDFDWEIYLQCNKDLQIANINDKDRAIDHWLRYEHKKQNLLKKK
jgi:hypothetical protein